MAQLDTTRNYNDGEVLVEADLDAFLDDIETFINVTKINDDNIQNNGITGSSKLLNQSVTEGKLASNSVTTLKIADSNVTTAKIADANITTAKINDLAITTAKINDDAVTQAKIADDAVGTDQLIDDAVTADILKDSEDTDADRAVTTDHIRDAAVTTAKINDGAVTPAKHSTNYVSNTLSGSASGGTLSLILQSSSLTTSGSRPVMVVLYGGSIVQGAASGAFHHGVLSRYDGSTRTTLKTFYSSTQSAVTIDWTVGGSMTFIDTAPPSGSMKYELTFTRNSSAAGSVTVTSVPILAYEL